METRKKHDISLRTKFIDNK